MSQTIIKSLSHSQIVNNRSNLLAKGVSMAFLAYFSLALMNLCGKALSDIPTPVLTFFQFFSGLLFMLPVALKHGRHGLKMQQPRLIFLRAFWGLLNVSALFFALQHIPLVDAVVLQNTVPLFVPLILLFWLKKSVPKRLWIALLLGFVGVIFIIKPSMHTINIGVLAGLASGIFGALSMLSISLLKDRGESTLRISFYMMLINSVLMLPFFMMHLDILPTLQWHHWVLLCSIGLFTLLTQTLTTHAFTYASTPLVSSLSYSVVVFSGLLGWIIWGHVPDWLSLAGIFAVIMGGVLAIIWER
jgi:drug/metabolite transporter (DMT)-like permease